MSQCTWQKHFWALKVRQLSEGRHTLRLCQRRSSTGEGRVNESQPLIWSFVPLLVTNSRHFLAASFSPFWIRPSDKDTLEALVFLWLPVCLCSLSHSIFSSVHKHLEKQPDHQTDVTCPHPLYLHVTQGRKDSTAAPTAHKCMCMDICVYTHTHTDEGSNTRCLIHKSRNLYAVCFCIKIHIISISWGGSCWRETISQWTRDSLRLLSSVGNDAGPFTEQSHILSLLQLENTHICLLSFCF